MDLWSTRERRPLSPTVLIECWFGYNSYRITGETANTLQNNMREKTILVGPRKTRNTITGMRIGFELLISGFVDLSLPHTIINRSREGESKTAGDFSLSYAIWTIGLLVTFYVKLFQGDNVYITIGTSRAGFFRDALMIWPSWMLRKKVILHLKGGGFRDFYDHNPGWLKWLIKHTFSKASVLIVLGDLLREQFYFVPEVEKKLRVVPNGLPKGLVSSECSPKKINAQDDLSILYLSNMVPSKGYLDVLKACHILHTKRKMPIQGNFCGAFVQVAANGNQSGDYSEDHFIDKIDKYDLKEVVRYHGTVTGSKKRNILQNADIFVLPTYYPWEGQPISIIEALAFGIPVISTEYRGIPEQVIDGYNGFLVSACAPIEIADAVERMWVDPNLYHELSLHAIEHFQKNFTQDEHLNRLISVILENDVEPT